MTVSTTHRANHEATDDRLNQVDGLIAALDVVQDQLRMADDTSPASMAFHTIASVLREKMAEVWACREQEWRGIGGAVGSAGFLTVL